MAPIAATNREKLTGRGGSALKDLEVQYNPTFAWGELWGPFGLGPLSLPAMAKEGL
jgi:hypothetical protein